MQDIFIFVNTAGVPYVLTLLSLYFILFEILLPSMGLFSIIAILIFILLFHQDYLFYVHYGLAVFFGGLLTFLDIQFSKKGKLFTVSLIILFLGYFFSLKGGDVSLNIWNIVFSLIGISVINFIFYLALRKVISLKKEDFFFSHIGRKASILKVLRDKENIVYYKILLDGVYWDVYSQENEPELKKDDIVEIIAKKKHCQFTIKKSSERESRIV